MGTGKQRTSLAVRVRVEPVIDPAPAELAVRVAQVELEALAELGVRVAQVELEALVVPEDQVAPVVRANRVAPVGLAVQAAPVALANRVAPAELAVRVALAGLANRVALELVPVVAVRVLDQVVLPLRTKSATVAHHRGQVPVRVVEDLAAAAETTRELAVTEVARVWEAAE